MINHVASHINLAKSILQGLDRLKLETQINTQTLELLLKSLIDLGTPTSHHDLDSSAARTVMARVVAIDEADNRDG